MADEEKKNKCLLLVRRLAKEQDIPQLERDLQAERIVGLELEKQRALPNLTSAEKRALSLKINGSDKRASVLEKRIEIVQRYLRDIDLAVADGSMSAQMVTRKFRELRLKALVDMHRSIGMAEADFKKQDLMSLREQSSVMKAARDALEQRATWNKDIDPLSVPVWATINAYTRRAFSQLADVLEKTQRKRLGGILVDDDLPFQRKIRDEMHGTDTGDVDAKRAAAALHVQWGDIREKLKKFGILIPTERDYFPQSHDVQKIMDNYQAWRKDMAARLDSSEYDNIETFLDEMVEHIREDQGFAKSGGMSLYGSRKVRARDSARCHHRAHAALGVDAGDGGVGMGARPVRPDEEDDGGRRQAQHRSWSQHDRGQPDAPVGQSTCRVHERRAVAPRGQHSRDGRAYRQKSQGYGDGRRLRLVQLHRRGEYDLSPRRNQQDTLSRRAQDDAAQFAEDDAEVRVSQDRQAVRDTSATG